MKLISLGLLWLCLSLSVAAQQARLVQRIFTVTAQELNSANDLTREFQAVRQARREKRDRLTWRAWQIITGPRVGGITCGAFGREWEDFNFEDLDNDVTSTLPDYFSAAKFEDNGFYLARPLLGRNLIWEEANPPSFAEVRYYRVAPGRENAFEALLIRAKETYAQTRQPRSYAVYRLSNGGPQTDFVIWIPLEKLSDIQNPDRGVTAILDAVIANENSVSAIIQRTGSELLRYRADLTYIPSP